MPRCWQSQSFPSTKTELGAYYLWINKKCVCDYLGSGGRIASRGSGRGGAGVVGFKTSKLAVNNRCNFGTFQICSSGNQQIKRTQHPTTPAPFPTLAPITDNSTQTVCVRMCVCVCVREGGRFIDRLQSLMQPAASWCKSTPSLKLHAL